MGRERGQMEKITLSDCFPLDSAGHSSKGNQLKWKCGNIWYKADHMGYEGLAEVVISRLLAYSNVPYYVQYEPVQIQYKDKGYNGCRSNSFLQEEEELITIEHLFRQYTGRSLSKELGRISDVKDRILYMVGNVTNYTGLAGFGKYVQMLLALDAFFLNEDRHTNNIAVIYKPEVGAYCLSPVFDNGLSLCSDTVSDFPMEKSVEECVMAVEAKPFSRDFDEQLDAAEELYGCNVRFHFGKKEVVDILAECGGYYPKDVVGRVRDILYGQMRKYQYMVCRKM